MTAFATIADLPVLDYRLRMPRSGVWALEASLVDERQPTTKKVTVKLGVTELKGSVQLIVSRFGTTVVRVLGGAGGLGTTATPKHYANTTIGGVVSDLLSTAGEQASSSADNAARARSLTQWTTLGVPCGRALYTLLASLGPEITWRILADGTLWYGTETWPEVQPEHEFLNVDPLAGNFTVYSVDRLVVPGTKFLGEKVSAVEHSLLGGAIRSTIWTE